MIGLVEKRKQFRQVRVRLVVEILQHGLGGAHQDVSLLVRFLAEQSRSRTQANPTGEPLPALTHHVKRPKVVHRFDPDVDFCTSQRTRPNVTPALDHDADRQGLQGLRERPFPHPFHPTVEAVFAARIAPTQLADVVLVGDGIQPALRERCDLIAEQPNHGTNSQPCLTLLAINGSKYSSSAGSNWPPGLLTS